MLLVVGPAPDGDPDPLATYHAMPHPKYVVVVGAPALGADAAPGRVGRRDRRRGRPPGADALFEALLDLQDLIVAEDPVARWQAGPARPAPSGPQP